MGVAALRKTRKCELVDHNRLCVARGRILKGWWLVLVGVKALVRYDPGWRCVLPP
jgi:hypothetical protein